MSADLPVETTRAKGKVDEDSNFPATAGSSKDMEVKVEGLETKLSTIQKAMGDGFDRVLKLKTIKRSSGGVPTEPMIMRTSHTVKVNQEVSTDSVPKGELHEWQQGYKAANPGIARKILCLSESVRWHKSKKNWWSFQKSFMKLIWKDCLGEVIISAIFQ